MFLLRWIHAQRTFSVSSPSIWENTSIYVASGKLRKKLEITKVPIIIGIFFDLKRCVLVFWDSTNERNIPKKSFSGLKGPKKFRKNSIYSDWKRATTTKQSSGSVDFVQLLLIDIQTLTLVKTFDIPLKPRKIYMPTMNDRHVRNSMRWIRAPSASWNELN